MYDKEYYRKQLADILNPLKKYYCGGKTLFSQHSAWYEDISADMEAFARPLWGLVPFWAGGGEDSDFEKLYAKGIAQGADKSSDTYWGECSDRNQRFVEMAAIAYGIIFAPEKVWEPLGNDGRGNLVKWLWQINEKEVCDSNWIFFRVLVNIALKSAGVKYDGERLQKDLERIDEFYIGNGWYSDGTHGQKDYYIAFAIHFYSLIYAITMADCDSERAEKYKLRACELAKTFIYWFDEDGEALPYGRSLTYRFAQVSFWSACVIADIRPFPLEVIKGIITRNLNNWLEKDIFDRSGILTVGYDYPNLIMAEHYNAHGSPYWGLKAYAFLMLPEDHEFWKCEIAPMPDMDGVLEIREADMIISRRKGKSAAYVGSNNESFHCGQIIPKYLKFAYSAHFGFNVMHSNVIIDEAAPDSMLAFDVDGLIMVRRHFKDCQIENGKMTIEWSPFTGIDVKTVITPERFGHVREHTIVSDYNCTAYDAGFAVSNSDTDKCVMRDGLIASAKNAFQHCEVLSQTGGCGVIIPASPNTNLRYRKTVIPAMRYEIKKGTTHITTLIRDHMED